MKKQTAVLPRSQNYKSPLRYPGGKAKLADFVKAIFKRNNLLDGAYAEPYAGGASVALTLLFEEYASHVYINDLDPAVFAFWHSVLNKTDALCRLIRDTRATTSQWERQRRVYLNGSREPRLALGFSAFFLNRTNRSGIIRSAGMIGGKQQLGKWKIDARYNRFELIKRVEKIARYRDRIHLFNFDALDFLEHCTVHLPKKSLIYLDPPYYIKGQQRLYTNYYDEDDHAEVAESICNLPMPWIVSYDNTVEIRRLYQDYRKLAYKLRYTVADRIHGSEIMYFSDQLIIPKEGVPRLVRNSESRKRAA